MSENGGLGWSVGDTIDIKTINTREETITSNTAFALKGLVTRVPWPEDTPVLPAEPTESGSITLSATALALSLMSFAALI